MNKTMTKQLACTITTVALLISSIPAMAKPFAYIPNANDDEVSVVDLATELVVATIPVGLAPVAIAVHPGGHTVYVVNVFSDTVTPIDTLTNTVGIDIAVGSNPTDVAFSPTGDSALVTNASDDTVSVIDPLTAIVTSVITVGDNPEGVIFHPDGLTAYVINLGDDSISVIDIATSIESAVYTIAGGNNLHDIAITPDGSRILVVKANDEVEILETASFSLIHTVSVGTFPGEVAIHPSGSAAYVTNVVDDTLSVIDIANGIVTATVSVGDGPSAVAVSPAGDRVLVTNAGGASFGDDVSIIDPYILTSVTVPVGSALGGNPLGVGIVTHQYDGTVNGIALDQVKCKNLTTGLRVVIPLAGEEDWDCLSNGFTAAPGETVRIVARGVAR